MSYKTKAAYYNEFNPEAAAMLRQLIKDGHIAPGDVDDRSITEVKPDDLKPYTQCHFFAGIGGWSIGLRLAGWPDHRPVWTGSAPCQPFSSAGTQSGKADPRHLFPVWLQLISKCRPATIFGEQVASAVAHGWLDDVYQGLEAENYSVGSAVLPACSVGSPHKRDRLWFVAHSESKRSQQGYSVSSWSTKRDGEEELTQPVNNSSGFMANTKRLGQQGQGEMGQSLHPTESGDGEAGQPINVGSGMWGGGEWFCCPDKKQRLIKPDVPMLVNGFQFRSPIIHGLGNAIVPQVAAEFIKASI